MHERMNYFQKRPSDSAAAGGEAIKLPRFPSPDASHFPPSFVGSKSESTGEDAGKSGKGIWLAEGHTTRVC